MSRSVLLLGICVVLGWGCGDKSSKPNTLGAASATHPVLPPPVAPVAHQAGAPAPPPVPGGAPVPVASSTSPEAQPAAAKTTTEDYLEALNEAVGTFGREQKRHPSSLKELMENKYIRALPPAPQGKKFHYDAQKNQIVLISS